MNPICDYLGYLFLSYCLLEKSGSERHQVFLPKPSAKQPSPFKNFEIEYQWQHVNFSWPSRSTYKEAIYTKFYIPENVALTGIKYYKGQLYLSLPQIREGVPVTLATIPIDSSDTFNPLLDPFPSWEMNVKRDCNTLQSVQSMEIDKNGIMWALDGFRINNNTGCPPKLVLLDLNNYGKVVLSYIFPKEVCLTQGGFLKDIVVDESDGGYAYITDNSRIDPGLIVYSKNQNRAWKLRDGSMFAEKDASGFIVNHLPFNHLSPIDGIALSPPHVKTGKKLLFYSSLTSMSLYSIKTNLIKNEKLVRSGEWRRAIKNVGTKQSQSDGLMMDNEGNLFYTLLPLYGVGKWNINKPFATAEVMEKNNSVFVWPNGFALDDRGNLRVLVNNMNKYFEAAIPMEVTTDVQFRILKTHTGTRSYLSY